VGQRTFETRSLYLILAETLFTLSAAKRDAAASALFAGKYQEFGRCFPMRLDPLGRKTGWPDKMSDGAESRPKERLPGTWVRQGHVFKRLDEPIVRLEP
jgi:hypothetical protein